MTLAKGSKGKQKLKQVTIVQFAKTHSISGDRTARAHRVIIKKVKCYMCSTWARMKVHDAYTNHKLECLKN